MTKIPSDTLLHFVRKHSSYNQVRLAFSHSCASYQKFFCHVLTGRANESSLLRVTSGSSKQLKPSLRQGGFSFVELIVTAAITTLVFGGIFASYESIITIIRESRMKASALALATERIEYIRSLPYTAVGTNGGVPAGALPQTSTTTLNGTEYVERILISYIDDDADGLAGADTNAITSDYKLVKVEYSWQSETGTSSIFHTTNIVPLGIETTAGGGTIRVNVFDATTQPVSGAEVRFVNSSSSIDTSRFTGAAGEAYLSGAPAGGGYEIYVTRAGYSSDGTYLASTTNPNPITPVVSVLENQVSTMNFQIDELSDLTVLTLEPPTYGSFEDQFLDGSGIATSSNTVVVTSALTLLGTPGSYPASGSAQSVFITPPTLYSWGEIDSAINLPVGTSIRIYVYYDSATPTLVPDSDLPGNGAGFTVNPIDLSGLSASTYDELALVAVLETTDSNVTPSVLEWEVTYVADRAPIASVPVTVTLDRSIGTDAGGVSIPKFSESVTTDGSGEFAFSNIEWGPYEVTEQSGAYSVSEVCPYTPYGLAPGDDIDLIMTLVPAVSATMRVFVRDAAGDPIADADVLLEEGGYSETLTTSPCGQVFFDTPGPAPTYIMTVSKSGYATQVFTDLLVATTSTAMPVTLVP